MSSLLHRAIKQKKISRSPFWFMRQAGRYLPEYRRLRTKSKSFFTLCYTPGLAAEITLQPVRRFDMDAAIIFSDILVVPQAMGVTVEFIEGEGPRLSPVRDRQAVNALRKDIGHSLEPVAEAIKLVRRELQKEKSLIGFCGAPWTVACYMVEGESSKGWEEARKLARVERKLFSSLIDKIIYVSHEYLLMQVDAGADIIQIFDSWAGVLSESEYRDWVIAPTKKLVQLVRKKYPSIPIIGFPRGSGILYETYARETGVDVVSIDFQTPMLWAFENIPGALQGNLDPMVLATDRKAAISETKKILKESRGKPFIFNLGHGILQYTPVDNVMAVCDTLRESTA